MLEHGYRTKRLAFDAGSSLIPAAAATAEAAIEREADEEEDLSEEDAARMRANLQEAGFTLRPVHSKAPWRQSNVESSVRSIKRILKASFLPSLEGMTPISFVRAVQMSVHTVNLRPVVLMPYEAANPGELTAISPTALRGPDSAGWPALGRSRNFTGQIACISKQQESFKQKWRTFYSKVVRRTHNMAQTGEGFSVGNVVMLLDLSVLDLQNCLIHRRHTTTGPPL